MPRRGRPRAPGADPRVAKEMRFPLKETDVMKQMRAAYLLLPPEERSYQKIAQKFGFSYEWVKKCARAFHWDEEAKRRDLEFHNPILGIYRPVIQDFMDKSLILCWIRANKELAQEISELSGTKYGDILVQCGLDVNRLREELKASFGEIEKDGKSRMNSKEFHELIKTFKTLLFDFYPNSHVEDILESAKQNPPAEQLPRINIEEPSQPTANDQKRESVASSEIDEKRMENNAKPDHEEHPSNPPDQDEKKPKIVNNASAHIRYEIKTLNDLPVLNIQETTHVS